MSYIVFIDFDGPLFPKRTFLMNENKNIFQSQKCKELKLHPYITYWKMDQMAVGMLNNFAERGAKFVLSTSWSQLHDLPTLENLLKINGFNGEIHKDWHLDFNQEDLNRSQQIKKWLDSHPEYNQKYIMIDDVVSAPEIAKPDLMKMYGLDPYRIFLVDENNGILMKQYHDMLKFFPS